MGLVDFQIMFEKPLPTYFPGEVVNGQLVVNLSSEKKMAKIKVRTHHSTAELIVSGNCIGGRSQTTFTKRGR